MERACVEDRGVERTCVEDKGVERAHGEIVTRKWGRGEGEGVKSEGHSTFTISYYIYLNLEVVQSQHFQSHDRYSH